jgi:hypothetical protein
MLAPDETLSFELSFVGICCLTSAFSPFTSLVVLIRFRLETDAAADERFDDEDRPEKRI